MPETNFQPRHDVLLFTAERCTAGPYVTSSRPSPPKVGSGKRAALGMGLGICLMTKGIGVIPLESIPEGCICEFIQPPGRIPVEW